jgi:hypothetical protein
MRTVWPWGVAHIAPVQKDPKLISQRRRAEENENHGDGSVIAAKLREALFSLRKCEAIKFLKYIFVRQHP